MIFVSLIVAVANNNVIGKNNQLPWYLPKDLAYFKQITTGCPIVMGRRTYESIGKPLPNRLNIVITRDKSYQLVEENVLVVHNLVDAIAIAKKNITNNCEIYIIGGETVFAKTIDLVDKIYLSRILADFDGDTYLPAIDWNKWQLVSSVHCAADEKNAHAIDFSVYERI